jgi:monofunctional biosynthetic peptidoglycan transglycosylase
VDETLRNDAPAPAGTTEEPPEAAPASAAMPGGPPEAPATTAAVEIDEEPSQAPAHSLAAAILPAAPQPELPDSAGTAEESPGVADAPAALSQADAREPGLEQQPHDPRPERVAQGFVPQARLEQREPEVPQGLEAPQGPQDREPAPVDAAQLPDPPTDASAEPRPLDAAARIAVEPAEVAEPEAHAQDVPAPAVMDYPPDSAQPLDALPPHPPALQNEAEEPAASPAGNGPPAEAEEGAAPPLREEAALSALHPETTPSSDAAEPAAAVATQEEAPRPAPEDAPASVRPLEAWLPSPLPLPQAESPAAGAPAAREEDRPRPGSGDAPPSALLSQAPMPAAPPETGPVPLPRPIPPEPVAQAIEAPAAPEAPALPPQPASQPQAAPVWPSRRTAPSAASAARTALPWLRRAVGGLALVAAGLVFTVLALVVAYRWVDPPVSTLMIGQSLTGTSIDRRWVPIERISPNLIRAVVLSEDSGFCRHNGVDLAALEEAIEADRGGSTITMQVVKNLFLWPSRSYVRKAIEIGLAYLVDALWPKRRIMEVYLNIAEWGDGIFGAEAAARAHFDTSAARLTADEAALMAVALPNPIDRTPAAPSLATGRLAQRLLARMGTSKADLSCLPVPRAAPKGLPKKAPLVRGPRMTL